MIEGKQGDRLVVDSERAGERRREGVIVEVLRGFGGTHYRIRWNDGHESTYFPGAGSFKIVEATPQKT